MRKTVILAGAERALKKPVGFEASQAVLDAIFSVVQEAGMRSEQSIGEAVVGLATQAQRSTDLSSIDLSSILPVLRAFFRHGLDPAVSEPEVTPADCIAAIGVLGEWFELMELDKPFRGDDAETKVDSGVRRARHTQRGEDVLPMGTT